MLKFITALLLVISFQVQAQTEFELACNLERSITEVNATVLEAPTLFGNVSDAVTSEKNLAIGVSQSFSGLSRASKQRLSAQAKCEALRATTLVEQYQRWSLLKAQQQAANVELKLIEVAIESAKINLRLLDEQLSAQTITVNQHNDGRQVLYQFERRKAELKKTLSIVIPPYEIVDVNELIETAQTKEAEAAMLRAKAIADTGWDFTGAVGVRQPLSSINNGNSSTVFLAFSFKYSFGAKAALRAAEQVGYDTQALNKTQQLGAAQVAIRYKQQLNDLIVSEAMAADSAEQEIIRLQRILESLRGIDTKLALNTTRALELQVKGLEIDAAGARARSVSYTKLNK